jgi:hypothetical protein
MRDGLPAVNHESSKSSSKDVKRGFSEVRTAKSPYKTRRMGNRT